MNLRLLLFLYFVSLLNSLHSQNLCRKADTTSIPTTFVGMAIPIKLLGTVYFDKSCNSIWDLGNFVVVVQSSYVV